MGDPPTVEVTRRDVLPTWWKADTLVARISEEEKASFMIMGSRGAGTTEEASKLSATQIKLDLLWALRALGDRHRYYGHYAARSDFRF